MAQIKNIFLCKKIILVLFENKKNKKKNKKEKQKEKQKTKTKKKQRKKFH